MQVDMAKLQKHATLIRRYRSTMQVTPTTEWLAEYAWGPFSELAYGSTAESATANSLRRLHDQISRVAGKLENIVADRHPNSGE